MLGLQKGNGEFQESLIGLKSQARAEFGQRKVKKIMGLGRRYKGS